MHVKDRAILHVHYTISTLRNNLIAGLLFQWHKCRAIELYNEINDPPPDKTNKMACVPSELRSAWVSAQSDPSLCCRHEESLCP